MRTSRFLAAIRTASVIVCGALLLTVVMPSAATAQSLVVLHTFSGQFHSDGSSPSAGLVADSAGNLYGTTYDGGTFDFGTVFELPAGGGEKILHNFTGGMDGAYPTAALVVDSSGNLYGTTKLGGHGACDIGCGVVFKMTPQGKETVLYAFRDDSDGAIPLGGVVRDAAGNLYGTAASGGILTGACAANSGCGVVFKLDSSGHETVLYRFTGSGDGLQPTSPLVRDSSGNLYGTTGWFGNSVCVVDGSGRVYKIDRTGKETVLYSFTGGVDGGTPGPGALAMDSAGNLYGATVGGGDLSCSLTNGLGCGVVFKIDPSGNETVLYAFSGIGDGGIPQGGVVRDSNGTLYGTTSEGGSLGGPCPSVGCGVVFKIAAGSETVQHSFQGTDGQTPNGNLLLRKSNLYGTTTTGGSNGSGGNNDGVAFQLLP